MHKKHLGTIGEIAVTKDLITRGYSIFTDVGDNSKVDLIAYNDETFEIIRIQVKTATIVDGKIILQLRKSGPGGYNYKYKKEDFDLYALYVYECDKIVYLKMSECETATTLNFRVDPPLNNNRGCKFIDDYLDFPYKQPHNITQYDHSHSKKERPPLKPKPTKIIWPSNEELKTLLWEYPMTVLSKELGVSDRGIKRRCDIQKIQTPPIGYWLKK